MKKAGSIILTILMVTTLLAGCGQKQAADGPSSQEQTTEDTANTASAVDTASTADTASAATAEKEAVELNLFSNSMYLVKANDEVNESLQKQFPYITVHIEHVADNYEAVLKTKLQTGSAPDLFSWTNGVAAEPFVEAGQVADLSDSGVKELLLPNFAEAGSLDGKLYGIPMSLQSSGLLYNEECFEKAGIAAPPRTVDELKETIEKLKAAGIQPFASGLKEQWVCYQWFWFAQSPFTEDMMEWYNGMNAGTASFDNEGTREFFKVFDLMFENCGNNPLSNDFAAMCHELGSGEAAMAMMGDYAYSEAIKVNPEARLRLTGMPVDNNPEHATTITNASGIYIAEESPNKEAAIDFVKWALSKEGTQLISKLDGAGSTAACNPELELVGFSADGMKWIQDGNRTLPSTWNYWAPGIMDVIGKDLQAYFAGDMTIDQLMKDLDAQWKNTVQ